MKATWGEFFQDNFTVLVLLFIFVLSFTATIFIMHEQKEPDEYAKWAQGFTTGLLTSLGVAMNSRPARTQTEPTPPKEPVI